MHSKLFLLMTGTLSFIIADVYYSSHIHANSSNAYPHAYSEVEYYSYPAHIQSPIELSENNSPENVSIHAYGYPLSSCSDEVVAKKVQEYLYAESKAAPTTPQETYTWNQILKDLEKIKAEHIKLISAIKEIKQKEFRTQEALKKVDKEDKLIIEEYTKEAPYTLLDADELVKLRKSLDLLVEQAKALQQKKEMLTKQQLAYTAEIDSKSNRLNDLVKQNTAMSKKIDKMLDEQNEHLKMIRETVDAHKKEMKTLNSDQLTLVQLQISASVAQSKLIQSSTTIKPAAIKPKNLQESRVISEVIVVTPSYPPYK